MLAEAKTLPLNQGQQAAADGFFQFLFGADKEMKISGPAGTGKTFLMGDMIDRVLPRYFETCKLMGIQPEYDQVVMTATTNKAAEVLSLATGRPTVTIHSFMNLRVQDDYKTGRSKLTPTNRWTVHERKIIFIDEAYTIDTRLDQLIQEGTHNSKIIYVGDHCQLGPVGENISPIHYRGMPYYELTEPMRNAGQPALRALCQQLRNTVETGVFHPIKIVPGVIDLASDTQMEYLIGSTFQQQTRESRILAFTNSRVIQYNEHVRGLRQLPVEYGLGELLVNNTAIEISKKKMLTVEEEVEIIRQEPGTYFVHLGENASLEVRETCLKTRLGDLHTVALPVDREHFSSLVRYYSQRRDWDRYYKLKNTFPDLRPRDSATIHKAQGSTHESVFVDAGNLSTCNIAAVVARLLYVAASRAKSRVVFYGNLDERYGGFTE